MLSSPSICISLPGLSLRLSAKVFPNYKLEFQDGQGVGVEVIKPESLGVSPSPTHTSSPPPLPCPPPPPTPTPGPAGGGWSLIPCGSPPLPGQQPYSPKWLLSLRCAHWHAI